MTFRLRTGPAALKQARRLRRDMTDAEKRLWSRIRDRQISAFQFRKQVPIGSYIVDFCCLKEKLAIEVDGGQHSEMINTDAERTAWLEANGYRVLRFWNNDVLQNTDGVVEAIARLLSSSKVEFLD
ncbi:MAG TPA: endonuclease domain-containing protein [Dongiaceae bacterium]